MNPKTFSYGIAFLSFFFIVGSVLMLMYITNVKNVHSEGDLANPSNAELKVLLKHTKIMYAVSIIMLLISLAAFIWCMLVIFAPEKAASFKASVLNAGTPASPSTGIYVAPVPVPTV